jgi:hypothetical protein
MENKTVKLQALNAALLFHGRKGQHQCASDVVETANDFLESMEKPSIGISVMSRVAAGSFWGNSADFFGAGIGRNGSADRRVA